MSNHVHLLASAKNGNLSEILRDFKKYSSKQILATIQTAKGESRKDWMLAIFKKAGDANSRNTGYQFWRQDNGPKEFFSLAFTAQKISYIHNNPVEAGLVDKPQEYVYSSAQDYAGKANANRLPARFL